MATQYNRIYPYSGGALNAITVGASGYSVDFNAQSSCLSAFGYDTGKFYFEVYIDAISSGLTIGVGDLGTSLGQEPGATGNNAYGYRSSGYQYHDSTATAWGATYTTGDVIGVAIDVYSGKLWFSKNGVWQESGDPSAGTSPAYSSLSGTFFAFAYSSASGPSITFKFKDSDLTYSKPTAFRAMDDGNIFYTYAVRNYSSYPEPDCGSWYQYPSNTLNTNYARMGGHDNVEGSTYSYFEKLGPLFVEADYNIIEAEMVFDGENSSTSTCNLTLGMNKSVTPISPTAYSEADALVVTTETVAWSTVPAFSADIAQSSPDIADCVKEVIDLASWANGNNVMFIAKDNSSTNDANRFFDAVRQLISAGGIENQNHLLIKCTPSTLAAGLLRWHPEAFDGLDGRVTVLTNQNRTVEILANSDTYSGGTLGNLAKKFGRYYWEVVIENNPFATNSNIKVGVGTPYLDLSASETSAFSWLYRGDSTIYHTSPTSSWGSGFGTPGDIVGVAVDLYEHKIWFSVNGVWQESGSPSTGANPAFSNLTGIFYPYVYGRRYQKFTLNSIGSEFVYAIPTGFSELTAYDRDTYIYCGKGYIVGDDEVAGYWFDVSSNFVPGQQISYGGNVGGTDAYNGVFKIPNIYIPTTAEVLEARVFHRVSGTGGSVAANVDISFDTSEPPVFPTSKTDVLSKPRSTHPVIFDGFWQDTLIHPDDVEYFPDLRKQLREILDRPSWAYGADLQYFIENNSSPTNSYQPIYTEFSVGIADKTGFLSRFRDGLTTPDPLYAHIQESLQRYRESFSLRSNHDTATSNRSTVGIFGNTGKESSKFYFEAEIINLAGSGVASVGVKDITTANVDTEPGSEGAKDAWGYRSDGDKRCRGAAAESFGSTWGTGSTIGVAVDFDNNKIWFSLNGVWQASGDPAAETNPACTSVQSLLFPCVYFPDAGSEVRYRFSPADFNYTPPIGFEHLTSDTGSFFTIAVPELWPETHPPQYQWEDSGTITRDSTLYCGRAAGSVAQNVGIAFEHIYAKDAAVLNVNLVLEAASSQSGADCNLRLAFESDVDFEIPLAYTTADGKTATLAKTDWDAVVSFVSGTQYTSPDLQASLWELMQKLGWSYGNNALVTIMDNTSTDLSRRQIANPTDITSLESINYLLIEQTFGNAEYTVGREDNVSFHDEVDGEIEWDVVVEDTVGFDDSETDAPYPAYGYPSDTVAFGDEVDAISLSAIEDDAVGFGDEVDAIVLDGSAEDDVGFTDEVDAFTLSPKAIDTVDFSDVVDADIESLFSVGDYYHDHTVRGLELKIVELAPSFSIATAIPAPFVTTRFGMIASNTVPAPTGLVNLFLDTKISASGTIPAPRGVGNMYVNIELISDNKVPAPIANAHMYSETVLSVLAAVPAPVGTVVIGVEPQVLITGMIPAPVGKAILAMEREFGTLKYTRC